MASKRIYRVVFLNQGRVYEVYARAVSQGGLYGFVEVSDLIFGEKSSVVVDPSEERLRTEFSGVKRFHVPLHAVVRIDEVEKQGACKISEWPGKGASVMAFPMAAYPPDSEPSRS
ncbi:MAG: hypothetical protein B7Z66_11300 [Chromatiales bacterium 21-64-14]|nr:MAG: hypothetical protein B7Z66_11300 [Chromatiales bacterium 21-64-14]HQU16752.1 DUF1820 family protein [Gammaproteobacteria bacterium]